MNKPQVVFSRPKKLGWEDTFVYDLAKLIYCFKWLILEGPKATDDEAHLHLEGFLLHFRNIVNFLSGSGGSAGDLSLASASFCRKCGFDGSSVSEVRRLAKPVYDEYSGEISTYLAHMTQRRHETDRDWKPGTMLAKLTPALQAFACMSRDG